MLEKIEPKVGKVFEDTNLRKEWVQAGAEWWSQNEPAPEGWDANAQLQAAGFADGGPRN